MYCNTQAVFQNQFPLLHALAGAAAMFRLLSKIYQDILFVYFIKVYKLNIRKFFNEKQNEREGKASY